MKFKRINKEIILLFLILVIGFLLRIYKIDLPIADHHSWRQADTAAVARNFIKDGFDFLNPRVDNMAPVSKEVAFNPERLFYVEPPIYQAIIFVFYKFTGVTEVVARGVSIFFSLGAIIFLFLLVKKLTNFRLALLSSFFMAVLPYSVYYSRVVMPESEMLFTSIAMLYFFYNWLEKDNLKNFSLAVFFTAWALVVKTFPFFLGLPMFYLLWKKYSFSVVKQKKIWFFLILVLIPFVLWRLWIQKSPEGIPSFLWLFNLNDIRFRPAFFRWIFAERIGKLILGFWGLSFFSLGLVGRFAKKDGLFFHLWLLSFFIFVAVFASGNVTHDYYQVAIIPILCFFLAKGAYLLLFELPKSFNRIFSLGVFIVCFSFMIGFSWFEVSNFYFIQGGVDLAGEAVDRLTPKDALVLTGDTADVTLLYNTNRHGWAGGFASHIPNEKEYLEGAVDRGAQFYVTTKVGELKSSSFGEFLYNEFELMEESDQYALFDLRRKE